MCFLDGYGIGCLVLVKFTNGYTEIAQVEDRTSLCVA